MSEHQNYQKETSGGAPGQPGQGTAGPAGAYEYPPGFSQQGTGYGSTQGGPSPGMGPQGWYPPGYMGWGPPMWLPMGNPYPWAHAGQGMYPGGHMGPGAAYGGYGDAGVYGVAPEGTGNPHSQGSREHHSHNPENPGARMFAEMLGANGSEIDSGFLGDLVGRLGMDEKEFWMGAAVGAAVVLLLTNDTVKGALFKGAAAAKEKVGAGVESVKETATVVKETAAEVRERRKAQQTGGAPEGGEATEEKK